MKGLIFGLILFITITVLPVLVHRDEGPSTNLIEVNDGPNYVK